MGKEDIIINGVDISQEQEAASLQQEKSKVIASIRERVNGFYTIHNAGKKDKNEKAFVDEGIKEAVVHLMALGFRTYDSCYGHPELTPPNDDVFFQATPIIRIDTPLLSDYQDETANMSDSERDEMRRQAIEIEERLNALLVEFYKERQVAHNECQIIIERWYDDNSLKNKGEDAIKEAQLKTGPESAHPLVTESQKEWDDFSGFLEQYYMSRF